MFWLFWKNAAVNSYHVWLSAHKWLTGKYMLPSNNNMPLVTKNCDWVKSCKREKQCVSVPRLHLQSIGIILDGFWSSTHVCAVADKTFSCDHVTNSLQVWIKKCPHLHLSKHCRGVLPGGKCRALKIQLLLQLKTFSNCNARNDKCILS